MALLSRISPWSALADLQREMDQLVGTVFGGSGLEGGQQAARQAARAWAPAVDVFSRGGELVVRAELAGVDPERDVEISVADGVLNIRGQRRSEHRQEETSYIRMETTYGLFERTIPLPDGIDIDRIRATHDKGILEITIPAAAQISQVRKIPVQQVESSTSAQQTISAEPTPGDQTQAGGDAGTAAGSAAGS
jgi:HSP20 family protein